MGLWHKLRSLRARSRFWSGLPLRRIVAEAWLRTGLTTLAIWLVSRFDRQGRVVVLAYHKVLPTALSAACDALETEHFESQVRVLSRLFAPVDPDTAAAALHTRSRGRYPILFTFDDGYRNNATHAAPILRRHGVPAIVFLPTALLGGDAFIWTDEVREIVRASPRDSLVVTLDGVEETFPLHDEAARRRASSRLKQAFKKLPAAELPVRLTELAQHADVVRVAQHEGTALLDWDAVRALRGAGLAFGSHSSRHGILSRFADDALRADLAESQQVLARELGAPVRYLAYPNGHAADVDDRVLAAAREAGFTHAFTMERGVATGAHDPLLLPRFAPGNVPGSVVALELLRLLAVQVLADRLGRAPGSRGVAPSVPESEERLRVA